MKIKSIRWAYNYIVYMLYSNYGTKSNNYDEFKKVQSSDLWDLMELTHLIKAGREFQREIVLGRKEWKVEEEWV